MSRKRLIAILVIILALIILVGLIYFMFLAPVAPVVPEATPTVNESNQLPATSDGITTAPDLPRQPSPPRDTTKEDLRHIASSFVERYGSYSNQSGFSNLRELNLFMSNSLQAWMANYIANTNQADTNIYYGITTKAVVVEVVNYQEALGEAEFLVKTQRAEAIGTSANTRKFQQDATVRMKKEGGIWKVDWVSWVN
ncbi:MAG: hypothetical protein Q8Q23_04885 [bacterium]|nr:hypothetical protein [bacterium]